eukprot:Skav210008  [mRNA]  locus=scaffold1212:15184:15795:- [translate_table: standard]
MAYLQRMQTETPLLHHEHIVRKAAVKIVNEELKAAWKDPMVRERNFTAPLAFPLLQATSAPYSCAASRRSVEESGSRRSREVPQQAQGGAQGIPLCFAPTRRGCNLLPFNDWWRTVQGEQVQVCACLRGLLFKQAQYAELHKQDPPGSTSRHHRYRLTGVEAAACVQWKEEEEFSWRPPEEESHACRGSFESHRAGHSEDSLP